MKPHAPACERNRDPILAVLSDLLPESAGPARVLEIGGGTGQHAVYFAARLPHVHWQTTDVAERLEGIGLWLHEAGLPNLPAAVELNVDRFTVRGTYDLAFSANTAHIMSAGSVRNMFTGVAAVLRSGGAFALYGPFTRDGRHASESDRRFDASLRAGNAESGLRDVAAMNAMAEAVGLTAERKVPMPANNLMLVWRNDRADTSG